MATSDWAQEQLCQGSLKTVWNRVVQEPRFDREPDRRGLPWAGAAYRRCADVHRVAEYIFS